ncbi:hypothetical protein [Sporosarcina limicola]|uniref:Uncharacterized protein n=1 Tax=Sporosarcina limicola TaxID=34101 RepID=A0A927MJL5_9BACL|nr:hypothetical protein [Sporosarcina limicola]MBE1554157.1 hypothetical protein [Sporosarcina limicola]
MSETNEGRLEEVKRSAKWLYCFMGPVDVQSISEDMNWQIEQVEKAQQDVEKHLNSYREWFEEQTNFSNENEWLRESLAFYADSKNYQVNVVDQWEPEIKVMMDGGAKAAKLLEELK